MIQNGDQRQPRRPRQPRQPRQSRQSRQQASVEWYDESITPIPHVEDNNDGVRPPDPRRQDRLLDVPQPRRRCHLRGREPDEDTQQLDRALEESRRLFLEEQKKKDKKTQQRRCVINECKSCRDHTEHIMKRLSWLKRFQTQNTPLMNESIESLFSLLKVFSEIVSVCESQSPTDEELCDDASDMSRLIHDFQMNVEKVHHEIPVMETLYDFQPLIDHVKTFVCRFITLSV